MALTAATHHPTHVRSQAIERISCAQAEESSAPNPTVSLHSLSLDEVEPPAVKLPVPRIALPTASPPPLATVDDLRASAVRKLKRGSEDFFCQGVDVIHKVFTLFPMDNDAEENKIFTTLGVFVADESGSESEEGEQ